MNLLILIYPNTGADCMKQHTRTFKRLFICFSVSFFIYFFIALAEPCYADANSPGPFITIPESTSGIPKTSKTENTSKWKTHFGSSYGIQKVLPQTQPHPPQISAEAAFHMGKTSIHIITSGLASNFYGCTSLRMQLLSQDNTPINLTAEFRTTLPSKTMAINPWGGITIGKHYNYVYWAIGGQAGLFSAPMPNQRPLGPHLLINQYSGIGFRIIPGIPEFSFIVEQTFAGKVGSIIPGAHYSRGPLAVQTGFPINWVFADGSLTLKPVLPGISVTFAIGGTI